MKERPTNQLDYQAPQFRAKGLQRWWIDRIAGLVFTYIGLAIVLGMLVIAAWAAIEILVYFPTRDLPFTKVAIGLAVLAVVGTGYLISLGVSIRAALKELASKKLAYLEMERVIRASDPDTQSTPSHPPSAH